MKANGEEEIFRIIQDDNLLKDPNNWVPYGGNDTNFSVINNQQPNAVSSLIEKITNSIDSILLKKCKLNNIDPTSKNAPKSMSEAVEQFFNIKNGELSEITSTERRILSQDIQLIATGAEKHPDLLIFDNGEGQNPVKFPKTFLSISKGNKNNIYFVQGQFNMGSTGALSYCGNHRYQLIASKQTHQIFDREKLQAQNLLGFTLVRRHTLTEDEQKRKIYKNLWYEYFSIGDKVPSFEVDKIDVGLCNSITFKTGAIVKLFSYQLPRGCGGTIRDGLYHELNQSLYKPALPFLLSDKREKYISKKNIGEFDMTVFGNYIRLDDNKEILEREPIYEKYTDKEIGDIKIRAILLKKGQNPKQQSNRKQRYIGKKSIIFTINGQVHGFYGSAKTKEWGFNYLKDSLLIHIDCTNIKINFRSDLFMPNRYNLRESPKLDKLIEKIKQTLKNSALREANNERKNQLLKGTDNQNEANMIKNILSQNPAKEDLMQLLKNQGNLFENKFLKRESRNSFKKKNREHKSLQSKKFPSIFRVNLPEKNGEKVKGIPVGGKGIIEFETDVQNDYLQRPHEQGELKLEILGYNTNSSQHPDPQPSPNKVEDFFNTTISGPDDHSIKVTLEPTQKLNISDKIKLNARLSSPDGDIEAVFYVKITKQREAGDKKPPKKSKDFNPPPVVKVSKKNGKWIQDGGQEWNYEDWGEDSVLHIMTSENKVDGIAINLENNILKKYISKKAKDSKSLEATKNKYISQIYLHGLFLFNSIEKRREKEDRDSVELVSNIFKSYGEALLYLDVNEEMLKIFE